MFVINKFDLISKNIKSYIKINHISNSLEYIDIVIFDEGQLGYGFSLFSEKERVALTE